LKVANSKNRKRKGDTEKETATLAFTKATGDEKKEKGRHQKTSKKKCRKEPP